MNMNNNMEIKQQGGDEEEEPQFEDDITKQDYDREALYPTMYQVADYLGSKMVSESSLNCLTGRGIRVAVLDTGVDYTHSVFGGRGTAMAYQQAYGAARNASENTERQAYFPTLRVVAGIDYVGDGEELLTISDLHPDADPIDSPTGHGTKVASAIVATAPNVELIAIKVCSNIGSCPDFSMVDGLEYAIRQGAQIANCTFSSTVCVPCTHTKHT
jgi:subtilisin family serine protease